MKTTKFLFSAITCLIVGLNTQAQRTDRFVNLGGTGTQVTVNGGVSFPDKTAELQNLINTNKKNIKLNGNMTLGEIALSSNVHIDIKKGVVIKLKTTNGRGLMFRGGKEVTDAAIENVKIYCSECSTLPSDNNKSAERYTIDMSSGTPDENCNFVSFGKVTNFSLSQFYVIDNYTKINAITLATNVKDNTATGDVWTRSYTVQAAPTQGDIKLGYLKNGHVGYGLLQVQAAKNVNFHNLTSQGGVSLRLESGSTIAVVPTTEGSAANMDNLEGYNIVGINGWSAVTLSPHGRRHGAISLKNITAIGCSSAIRIIGGFQDRDVEGLPNFPTAKYKRGNFGSVTITGTIKHTYGTTAQLEGRDFSYFPQSLIKNKTLEQVFPKAAPYIAPFDGADARINTPSIATVLYFSKDSAAASPRDIDGQYSVNLTGATLEKPGFNSCIPTTIYANDKNKICSSTSKFSIDYDETALDTKREIFSFETLDNTISVSTKVITIHLTKDSNIIIYNSIGKTIKTVIASAGITEINASNFANGIYIVSIQQEGNIIKKKIIL
ncbi:T9SS type A sorting domain-containing protein [Flavobacterium faecale]|nr:T9SS type A sorting domain-containing protein [Flavobacterium faecale]